MPGWEGCEASLSQQGKTLAALTIIVPSGYFQGGYHDHGIIMDHGDNIDQDEVGRVEDDSARYPNS